MPAEQSARRAARRFTANRPYRSRAKTAVAKARNLIASGDLDEAKKAVIHAESVLDVAALKGVIHPNNSAGRKSRLWKRLNKASTSSIERQSS